MTDESAPPSPSRADRILLAAFAVQAVLMVVAALAQVTGSRGILDLLDFRRLFVT